MCLIGLIQLNTMKQKDKWLRISAVPQFFCHVAAKLIFLSSFMGSDFSTTWQNAYLLYIDEQYPVNMTCCVYIYPPAIKVEPFLRCFNFKDFNKTLVLSLFVCSFCTRVLNCYIKNHCEYSEWPLHGYQVIFYYYFFFLSFDTTNIVCFYLCLQT